MRCLNLASALSKFGAACHFICREHPGNFISKIRDQGYAVQTLPMGSVRDARQILYGPDWLGATEAEDAAGCRNCLAEAVDWLVVDHYGLGIAWETVVAEHARRLFVIDDLANRRHICDVLLDQNWYGDNTAGRYGGLLPESCKTFLGPEFALLDSAFLRAREQQRKSGTALPHLLVFLGGSDENNVTAKVVEALVLPETGQLTATVVLGQNHPDPEGVHALASPHDEIRVVSGLPGLAEEMTKADIMIGAGGISNWERLSLGIPAVIVSVADNQIPINAALAASGLITYLGKADQVTVSTIARSVRKMLANREEDSALKARMKAFVPGTGSKILAEYMIRNLAYAT